MRIILIVVVVLFLFGCSTVPLGNTRTGLETVSEQFIQPDKAVELASPYLEQTYALRKANSNLERREKNTTVWVTMKGDYYYIVKESYPSIDASFYLDHAVKVHKKTGMVIEPE